VFIAPALDPTTGKIQVKVSPTQSQTSLVDGSTVTVTLDRASSGAKAAAKNTLSIPIAAAKITPQGPVVFTVASSTLVSHPVTFGNILGGQVEITAGLTADMDIVVDARGLSEGQVVVVDSQ
jgi:multidrug efflux pump subunit AcrA (membrane-fusion protein)